MKSREAEARELLWNVLKNKQLDVKFERNRRFGKYRNLLYSSQIKLAIDVWDETEDEKNLDLYKSEDIQTLLSRSDPENRLLVVAAGDVLTNTDDILLRIIDRFERNSS